MEIVAERTVIHYRQGDEVLTSSRLEEKDTVPDRIRFYPYKVSYIDTHDFMITPDGQKLPIFTDIIRAKNSEDAKELIRTKQRSRTVAFINAHRYPERLGTSVAGVVLLPLSTLTKAQLKYLDEQVRNGTTKVPHAIDPSVFVTKNPSSTIHTRPTPSTRPSWPSTRVWPSKNPVGAQPSVAKSTPMTLSDDVLDVGGFSVGFRKPGEPTPAVPTVPRPTPQPDIYDLTKTTVPGGSLVSPAADLSSIAMPSGAYLFSTVYPNVGFGGQDGGPDKSSGAATGVALAPDPKATAEAPEYLGDLKQSPTGVPNTIDAASPRYPHYVPPVGQSATVRILDKPVEKSPLFFDTPDDTPTYCNCEPPQSSSLNWKIFVPLGLALAGIIYGMVKAWR